MAICQLCGEREAVRDLHGLPPLPPEDWPVPPDELGREFDLRAVTHQASEVREIPLEDIQPRDDSPSPPPDHVPWADEDDN
jgi:hypothetical protein